MPKRNDIARLLQELVVAPAMLRTWTHVVLPGLLFYGVSLLVLKHHGLTMMEILRDPAQQSGASGFIGFLSNIGVWLWIGSATICLFTFSTQRQQLPRTHRELLVLTGLLSLCLGVDDFFLIHDRYIDEHLCFLAYAFMAGALLWRHHRNILAIQGPAFLLACTLLGLSILTDLLQARLPVSYHYTQVLEEGFKFIGAATWSYYCAMIAAHRPEGAQA